MEGNDVQTETTDPELDVSNPADADEATSGEVTGTEDGIEDDGRTRCAWVREHPRHQFFHDAEFGRLPDSDPPCFERVLMTCLRRNSDLVDVLDQRMDIYEAFAEWNVETVAGAEDGALDELTERGGVFADGAVLRWIRDVAASCVETGKEYRGLRNYFLALPSLSPEEMLLEMQHRFADFTKEDAANLLQLVGSVQECSHDRDCWIA